MAQLQYLILLALTLMHRSCNPKVRRCEFALKRKDGAGVKTLFKRAPTIEDHYQYDLHVSILPEWPMALQVGGALS